jgi:hypothetical protein
VTGFVAVISLRGMATPAPDLIRDLDDLIAELREADLLQWFRERIDVATAPQEPPEPKETDRAKRFLL